METNITQVYRSSEARLTLLYRLSTVFSSSLDLQQVLERVMDEVIKVFRAERGFVMLYNDHKELVFQAARGIAHETLNAPEFQVSYSIIRKVAEEGQPLLTSNASSDQGLSSQRSVLRLKLHSVLCVPLQLKETTIGVVYVDNSARTGIFTEPDRDLLAAIAATAAVSIDNARSHMESIRAVEKSLEAMAKFLELRDYETKGHCERVVDLTLQIGKQMGFSGEDLVQLKRGALLHDYGKNAIPDSILLKPGPLSDEEMVIMRRHPGFAYDQLSPVEFLRPALDIPYCHHEKWDGTGYPRGLKGDQIPLPARIFAIVDVWDALTNNRVYRKAWPEEATLEYLHHMAGSQFDPAVVAAFVNVKKANSAQSAPGN
jgi:HD-GYP domain-containing protein (c-di-GMP phosphodiesterase class II)